jgi:hypothetical protein
MPFIMMAYMAVEDEVALDAAQRRSGRAMFRLLRFLLIGREQQHRRHFAFHDERFGRPHAADVEILAAKLPARRMRMEVVPGRAGVEVEHVPSDTLAAKAGDGRRVADKAAAIDAMVVSEAPCLEVTV